jgi:hypothetical protein
VNDSLQPNPAVENYANCVAALLGEQQPEWKKRPVESNSVFNLFRFLRITRLEAVLHTRILAWLLDAESPLHGLGNQFLRSVLGLLLENERLAAAANSKWKVKAEEEIDLGRIDILLRCEEHGILIALENKIDAGLGPNQLLRYYEWMQQQPHDTRISVFLTIDGSEPAPKDKPPSLRLLSYQQLLPIIKTSSSNIAPAAKPLLEQYIRVLQGIVPRAGSTNATRVKVLGRLAADELHYCAAVEFLADLVSQWRSLPVLGRERPIVLEELIPVLSGDTCYRKYPSVEIWPQLFQKFATQNLDVLLPWVGVDLSQKKWMGLWVGLHWTELWRRMAGTVEQRNRSLLLQRKRTPEWLREPEGSKLLGVATKIFDVPGDLKRGQWVAIAERIEYPRTDGGLVSAFQYHGDELKQTIAAHIADIWSFCGREVVDLNKKVLSRQGIANLT